MQRGDERAGGSPKLHQEEDDEQQFEQTDEDVLDVGGATGGGGDTVDSALRKGQFTEEEIRIITQTQILLSRYVMDSATKDHMPHERLEVLRQTLQTETRQVREGDCGADADLLGLALMTMGDDVNFALRRDKRVNYWIESVPVESAESVFSNVCTKMFSDGEMNWGRIVVLFYLAYRLIAKSYSTTKDWASWIKKILRIAIDFFCKFYVNWVFKQGGWKMILDSVHTSTKVAVGLTALAIVTFLYYLYSD